MTVFSGWTESEERILERMKRILADFEPPADDGTAADGNDTPEVEAAAAIARLTVLKRLNVLCFAVSLWIRRKIYQ